jgi:hypothetical protein
VNAKNEIEWIWPGDPAGASDPDNPYEYVRGVKDDVDTDYYHGTCIFSKAVGPRLGISRNAQVTVVGVPKTLPTEAEKRSGVNLDYDYRTIVLVDALVKVLDDIVSKNLKRKAVVNLSLGILGAKAAAGTGRPFQGDPNYAFFNSSKD